METLQQFTTSAAPVRSLSERSRSIRAYELKRAFVLLASDVVMLAIASSAAAFCYSYFSDFLDYSRVLESAVIWTLASVWTFKLIGLYRISYSLDKRDEWYHVIVGLGISVAPLLIIFTIVPAISSSRIVLLFAFVLSAVLVGISRSIIHSAYGTRAAGDRRRVALVASPTELPPLANAMDSGMNDLRLIPVTGTDQAIADVVSGNAAWYEQIQREGCDEIVFAGMPAGPVGLLVERAARDHIDVGFAPADLRTQLHGLDFLISHRQPCLVARRIPACTPINLLFKRLFDIVGATIGLLIAWPFMLLATIAILIESGRPVIFSQERIGRDGKPFRILKFRSMARNAEAQCGPVWAVGDPTKDQRVSKVGALLRKTSIDELPQFINVLLGDMSIVGPRPERPIFVELFRKQFPRYDERHLVRPGITGWAHAHMRRSPDMDQIGERLELDLFYIENYSLLLDVFIAFKTGVEVLFHRWA